MYSTASWLVFGLEAEKLQETLHYCWIFISSCQCDECCFFCLFVTPAGDLSGLCEVLHHVGPELKGLTVAQISGLAGELVTDSLSLYNLVETL